MVDQVSTCLNVDAERKVYINYWFRHVWEYWFPLYQGVVLAVSILGGVNLGSFMIWGGYRFRYYRSGRYGCGFLGGAQVTNGTYTSSTRS